VRIEVDVMRWQPDSGNFALARTDVFCREASAWTRMTA
jgi:hypothetical protein